MKDLIVNRLSQPSTWRGAAVLLAMFGFAPSAADTLQSIAQWVVTGIGLWELVRNGRTFARGGVNA